MEGSISLIVLISCLIYSSHGFYKPNTSKQIPTHTPETLDDLKKLLCTKQKLVFVEGGCDSDPKKIVINKVFDFTDYEGTKYEPGCRHDAFENGCPNGLWKLTTVEQSTVDCGVKQVQDVQYSVAGLTGLEVGSNKIIIGKNGGGLKGKGLKLDKSSNVQIRNLAFADINPHLNEGGSAIEMIGAKNVLIYGNYFKNISQNMVRTKGGSTTGVTISTNFFDGRSSNSYFCDGTHRSVWSFGGESERIRLEHNSVYHASGGALTVSAQKNSKSVVHLFQNVFSEIKHSGAIQITDRESSVFVEGNVFTNMHSLVNGNQGNLFIPWTETDEVACEAQINRKCEANTVINVENTAVPANNIQVMNDIKAVFDADARPWWLFGSKN